jgi:hypothetical protein
MAKLSLDEIFFDINIKKNVNRDLFHSLSFYKDAIQSHTGICVLSSLLELLSK